MLKSQLFGYSGPHKGFIAKQSPFHCAHPRQVRAVTPDGDVYTCHRALYNFDNCILPRHPLAPPQRQSLVAGRLFRGLRS